MSRITLIPHAKKKKKDGIQIEPRVSLPEAFHPEYRGAHAGSAVSAWNSATKRRSARTARASNSVNNGVNAPPRATGPKAEPGSSARWELSGRPADPTFVLGIKKENARNAWILC